MGDPWEIKLPMCKHTRVYMCVCVRVQKKKIPAIFTLSDFFSEEQRTRAKNVSEYVCQLSTKDKADYGQK